MGTETIEGCTSPPGTIQLTKPTPEYLQELLKDKRQLQTIPGVFHHVEKLLENEINRVRFQLFHINGTQKKPVLELPEPDGSVVTLQDKVWIPVKDNPNYNFVGRLLGPRGMTAKQFEYELGCKIMIRGRGSMRDKKKEEQNRGKPNWEHLAEELHVLICVEDTQNRAEVKLRHAVNEISRFLEEAVRTPEGQDTLKQLQLMELAMLNGTYRDTTSSKLPGLSSSQANKQPLVPQPLTAAALGTAMNPLLRAMAPNAAATGSPIVLATTAPRLPAPAPLFSPDSSVAFPYQTASLGATNADYQYLLAAAQSAVPTSGGLITEYPSNPALMSVAGNNPHLAAAAAAVQAGTHTSMDAQTAAAAAGILRAASACHCNMLTNPAPLKKENV